LKDGSFQRADPEEGWLGHGLYALHADDEGSLWIGTSGGGLSRLKGEAFTHFTTGEGLFDDTIYAILDDRRGYLWMSCNKGIFRVRKSELVEVAEGKRASVRSVSYGVGDGMKSAECNGSTQPAGWRSQDGRLWFTTAKGAVVVDPSRADESVSSPAALMEEVLVESRPVRGDGAEAMPSVGPGSRQFEFHYTALARTPERVGIPGGGRRPGLVDAGARRVAYYTSLPPGPHRFRVIAGSDGERLNEAGALLLRLPWSPTSIRGGGSLRLCAVAVSSVAWAGHADASNGSSRWSGAHAHRERPARRHRSSLSQIAILSEGRGTPGVDGLCSRALERIATLSRESVDAMGEIVALSTPIATRPRPHAAHAPAGQRPVYGAASSSASMLPTRPTFTSTPRLRREVFLIFQGGSANVLRHGTQAAWRSKSRSRCGLRLVVQDDGRGFDNWRARTAMA
jgi:hypothetical protein